MAKEGFVRPVTMKEMLLLAVKEEPKFMVSNFAAELKVH